MKKNSFVFLVKFYLKYAKAWFFVVCLSTLISPLLAYIDVVVLRDSIELATNENSFTSSAIIAMCLWLAIYVCVVVINSIVEVFFGERMNVVITNRINKSIYSKVLTTDYKYFDDTDFYNDYTWALNNLYGQTFSAVQLIWRFLMSIFTIGTIGTLMLTMDWVVLVIVLTSVVIDTFINIAIEKEVFKKRSESIVHQRILSYVQRVFYDKKYAMEIKSTQVKKLLLEKYDDSTTGLSNIVVEHRMKTTILSILKGFTMYFTKTSTLCYLIFATLNNSITIGEFSALFYASISLSSQLGQFVNLLSGAKKLNLYTERIKHFFELPSEIENKQYGYSIDNRPLSLEFKSVCFKYHADSNDALNNVCFSIKSGEKIALVGKNGAGKSTIAKLILHLYNPSHGNILIDGKMLNDIDLVSLRSNIGIAFQDNLLYAFTFKDNLDVYCGDISENTRNKILDLVGLTSVLSKNKATVESYISKELDASGIELSGGEKQSLAVSRVLTRKFGLIIFDEPTSSLDPIKESALYDIILNRIPDTTIILIAHRLSAIKKVDRILYVEDGCIAECGTHQELMNKKGKYYEMYRKQSEGYIE